MKSAILAAVLFLPCFAQTPTDAGDQAPIRFDVTRVSLLFTVQDKKGRFITDLTKDEFQIVENKKPQAIAEFTAAITKDPRDPFSYIRRATAYEKKRANALAIADYRKVLTLVDEDSGTEFAAKIRKLEKTKK